MARSAAEDHAADWVIGCDGDEFWWPRGGSLKDVLASVPPQFGVVEAPWRFFLPRTAGPPFFAERMTLRLSSPAALVHPHSPFKPGVKVAHRADPALVVQGGSHRVLAGQLATLPGWHPVEVLHFPIRDLEQCVRRYEQWGDAGRNWRFARASITDATRFFASVAVDDEDGARGLEQGTLGLDLRLRDALRSIRNPDGDPPRRRFLLPGETGRLGLPDPSAGDERAYIGETRSLAASPLLALGRRLDALGARVSRLESSSRLGSAR
jgi:hypothetical protein